MWFPGVFVGRSEKLRNGLVGRMATEVRQSNRDARENAEKRRVTLERRHSDEGRSVGRSHEGWEMWRE